MTATPPPPPPADTRTVTIELGALTDHLGCVLCLGMLREAHTIPECLHSFCKSCIYRHFLVQGSRQCPKCMISLKPRPITTLISDQKLQDVVDRIFPEFKENDTRLEREFYESHGFERKPAVVCDNDAHVGSAENAKMATDPVATTTADITNSDNSPSRRRNPPRSRRASAVRKRAAPALPNSMRHLAPFTIEVLPQPGDVRPLDKLRLPYLQVEGRFKMFELLKWVRRQLSLAETAELEVTCMGATVGPELSVYFIHRTIWLHKHDETERLVLHYRLLIP